MCRLCDNYDFGGVGVSFRDHSRPHLYFALGGAPKEEERFKHCPICGKELTEANFSNVKWQDADRIWGKKQRMFEERFYTVFPKDPKEMPHDSQTWEEAKEYGDERFGEGNYTIETPFR